MKVLFLFFLLQLLLFVFTKDLNDEKSSRRFPIVFVYTVVPAVCSKGLPKYIKESLQQAIITQPDCDVIIASNFADCASLDKDLSYLQHLIKFDTTKLRSNRTKIYQNASTEIFQHDNRGELWLTSALRFFLMEDLMTQLGYDEILHVEADNLLYGRVTSILNVLRSGYKGIAATPLTANKSFITASVFWISNFASLVNFNNYLMDLAQNNNKMWGNYLVWLRKYACCKPGGLDPDENGNGIKPFAVNEMSMLGYYHHLHAAEFKLLPVVPNSPLYFRNRHVCDIASFSPGGYSVGPSTGHGIWDSNSWGQFIGGTSVKKGRDKGFTDSTHISGQAMRTIGCKMAMLCTKNFTAATTSFASSSLLFANNKNDNNNFKQEIGEEFLKYNFSFFTQEYLKAAHKPSFFNENLTLSSCYTAPHVTCGTTVLLSSVASSSDASVDHQQQQQQVLFSTKLDYVYDNKSITVNSSNSINKNSNHSNSNAKATTNVELIWTPLWNLHVHSKHTFNYRSLPCNCFDD